MLGAFWNLSGMDQMFLLIPSPSVLPSKAWYSGGCLKRTCLLLQCTSPKQHDLQSMSLQGLLGSQCRRNYMFSNVLTALHVKFGLHKFKQPRKKEVAACSSTAFILFQLCSGHCIPDNLRAIIFYFYFFYHPCRFLWAGVHGEVVYITISLSHM